MQPPAYFDRKHRGGIETTLWSSAEQSSTPGKSSNLNAAGSCQEIGNKNAFQPQIKLYK